MKPFQNRFLTNRTMRWGLAIATALAVSACQFVPVDPIAQDRSVLLQRMDAVVQGARADMGVRLSIQPDTVVTGQTLSVDVTTARAGYLYLYQISTDGKILNVVFPNAIDGANYIQPGTTQLPRVNWQLRAHGPEGVGYLVAIVTPQPLNSLKVQGEANLGQFMTQPSYGAATAALREMSQR